MKSGLQPRTLLIAFVTGVVAFLLAPAAGLPLPAANAAVASITASTTSVIDNQNVTITVTASDDSGPLQVNSGDSGSIFTAVSCSGAGACGPAVVSGLNTSAITIDTDLDTPGGIDADNLAETLTVTLTLRVDCDFNGEVISVAAFQPGGSTRTVNLTCGSPATGTDITIRKNAGIPGASYRFVFSVTNGSCAIYKGGAAVAGGASGYFYLSHNQSVRVDCSNNAVVTITEDAPSSLVDVTGCSGEPGVTEGSRSVRINLAQTDGNVTCTFNNLFVATPASIQLSASNLTPNCGATTILSAYVIDNDGTIADNGTVVTFSVSAGTLSATQAATVNGVASVVYSAPANFANLVTISAVAGPAFAQGQIRVVCAVPTAVAPALPPALPAAPTATPRPPQPVTAPSAGDGGLLSTGAFNWPLFAAILLAATVSVGVAFVTQKDRRS